MDRGIMNRIGSRLAAALLAAALAAGAGGSAFAHQTSAAVAPPFSSLAGDSPSTPQLAQTDYAYAQVVLNCMVADQGAVTDCQVVSEDPAGSGYGAAVLKMATRLHVPLKSDGGAAVPGARLNIPISIRVAK